jgi:polysaccharide export outer membrane protein
MKMTLQQLALTHGSTRGRAARTCKTALAVLSSLLAACSIVPGQHMQYPPSVPVSVAPDGTVKQAEQIPIQTIDLNLIKQLNEGEGQMELAKQLNLFAKPAPYKLGPGDVLQITVWDHPELAAAQGQQVQNSKPGDPTQGFVIDGQGDLTFPYVSRPIHAAGMSVHELQRRLDSELSKVFRQPQITVRVASYRSSQVYVDGEVRAPGGETINDIPMTLTEAINRAGGFTPNADRSHLTLTRNGTSYPIDLTLLIKNDKNPQDIMLQPGDMLRVTGRDENTAYVMGEVNKPTAVAPTTDGKLTLSEALAQAGFLNQNTANPRQLYVIRQEKDKKPQVYHLDSASPVSMLLANQFDLQPKDVVYVDNGPLVRFNRVLSLLLPAINAGLTAAIVTK